jgi:hypothetical protein
MMQTEKTGSEADVPHDDELDVEAPNESAPGHNPDDDETDPDSGND